MMQMLVLFKKFLKDKKAQGQWNMVYLLLVGAIVVVILIAKIKPMFHNSMKVGSTTQGVANAQHLK